MPDANVKTIQKSFAAPPPGDDPLEYVMSDGTVDRVGDIIEPRGWQIENFKKNPIALFNHNPNFPLGTWKDVRVENNKLIGRLELGPAVSEDMKQVQAFI